MCAVTKLAVFLVIPRWSDVRADVWMIIKWSLFYRCCSSGLWRSVDLKADTSVSAKLCLHLQGWSLQSTQRFQMRSLHRICWMWLEPDSNNVAFMKMVIIMTLFKWSRVRTQLLPISDRPVGVWSLYRCLYGWVMTSSRRKDTTDRWTRRTRKAFFAYTKA
jgi:hypothetical protein